MKGDLSWLVRWTCTIRSAGTRDMCSVLAALVGPVQLTVHYFSSFLPIVQQAGQTAVLGRLSLSVFFSGHPPPMWQKLFTSGHHTRLCMRHSHQRM